ncbi:MAG: diguanylate cyclase [Alkalimonas sp.]|nr:diguanylate cyclase [Alkalimonas sp.]
MQSALRLDTGKHARQIDASRRIYILSFVSYIAGAVMVLFGFISLDASSLLLPGILFTGGSLFFINILFFHLTKQLDRACQIEAILVAIFVLALIYHGGHNNTALYWAFPFPAILFGLLGVRKALISNGILMLLLGLLLLQPDLLQADYKESEVSRFLASMLIVIIVCWINDHFRERSHEAMSELQKSKDMEANTDPLTQLVNRRYIEANFAQQLHNYPQHYFPLGVVMCDIDHFKDFNDQYGHDVGDEVLKTVADIFRSHLRPQDIACRNGGEEFLLLLPQTGLSQSRAVAEKIRAIMANQPFLFGSIQAPITASFGVTACDEQSEFQAAIKTADQQLYQAKAKGRNQVQ